MKVEPVQNTSLFSKNPSTSDRWEQYLKNKEYLPRKEKKDSKEENLKDSDDPHLLGYA